MCVLLLRAYSTIIIHASEASFGHWFSPPGCYAAAGITGYTLCFSLIFIFLRLLTSCPSIYRNNLRQIFKVMAVDEQPEIRFSIR